MCYFISTLFLSYHSNISSWTILGLRRSPLGRSERFVSGKPWQKNPIETKLYSSLVYSITCPKFKSFGLAIPVRRVQWDCASQDWDSKFGCNLGKCCSTWLPTYKLQRITFCLRIESFRILNAWDPKVRYDFIFMCCRLKPPGFIRPLRRLIETIADLCG